jgi:hypothetical protein
LPEAGVSDQLDLVPATQELDETCPQRQPPALATVGAATHHHVPAWPPRRNVHGL